MSTPLRAAVAVLAFALLSSLPRLARADDYIYFDAHPVHPAAGGGFCELPGAHVHDYAPVDGDAFARREGLWFFVGDPVVYGYRGPVYSFVGPHEVPGSSGFAACTREGLHHHLYAPDPAVDTTTTVWLTQVVAPVVVPLPWWDDRPLRRAAQRPPHAYPTLPPPVRVAPPPPAPPASRALAPRSPAAPRRPTAPGAPAAPPPARRR